MANNSKVAIRSVMQAPERDLWLMALCLVVISRGQRDTTLNIKTTIGNKIIAYYILEKIKFCKESGVHYSAEFPHSTGRKTVTIAEIFVACKEEQQQSSHS